MSKHKNLKRNLLICLLAGSAVMYTLPLHAATSVIGNNTLPTGGSFVHGNGSITSAGLEMNVIQNGQNAVIKWGSFDVGGSATVNFSSKGAYANNFNTLNYVNSASASQIYGTINAQGGNIFIVNPAGVQIGNSAQINVGSLYVSSNTLNDSALKNFYNNAGKEKFVLGGTRNADIELMSLGNINANKVTFEGNGRIVIDSERLKDVDGTEKLTADKIFINTKDENNLVIGYDGYDENKNNGSYNIASNSKYIATVNGKNFAQNKGYMWVEDVKQLQAIDTNLGGNYALRNSIDGTQANNFKSIGSNTAFTGNFDGIDYNIFGLTIKNGGENTGLFGYTNNATISNVTLVGGSITGSNNVGAVVGNANNTILNNVVNSAAVSGNSNVGGIVGTADGTTVENAINTGTIEGNSTNSTSETNVGGLIGEMKDSDTADNYKSQIIGNSYNLGDVSGNGHNVGGLVGHAVNSVIGNEGENAQLVYNRMDVTGAYNVGGIVGNMVGSIVQNAENSGTVLATGHTNGEYTYHTDETKENNLPNDAELSNGIASVDVNVANVGGIAGTSSNSTITDVLNTGDVSSSKGTNNYYYDAGNVGGIVGSAVDTNIKNATNRENEVRGAHNVGGVAGYFGGEGTVSGGINDGGDIMATGARYNNNFVKEQVRPKNNSDEKFIIGNIGGVVGYMDGDKVYVTGSANRGTVHTDEPDNPAKVEEWQKAANVGGIVGKIDSDIPITDKNGLGENYINAAVSNSYNTGDVLGYTGIGGIAGMMYNGAIASSYNLGDIRTTRQSDTSVPGENEVIIDPINMGGIVGDTTEQSSASVYLYDVYNKGKIGDETYTYFGRHVGGIVGRLSGTVEKAYNTGAIYNGYNVVGGIAGWMVKGSIKNSFNTGNITVNDKNNNANSEVGGIVGAADISAGDIHIDNVYNLGTIRSFKIGSGKNEVGGIIGGLHKFYFTDSAQNQNHVYINNAYTTGNLYAKGGTVYSIWVSGSDDSGANAGANRYITTNTYYIKPENGLGFNTLVSSKEDGSDNSNKAIEFADKSDIGKYQYDENDKHYSLTFTQQTGGDVDGGGSFSLNGVDENGKPILIKLPDGQIGDWRIYDGNTPILNAFLPDSEKYFAKNGLTDNSNNTNKTFNGSIQYGTAYDPLLTIINTDRDLVFNFGTTDNELSITNAAGLAVYGGGVTLNNFTTSSGSGYFGGTIYADGALNLNGGTNDIGLGSAADIYGSAVNITTGGKVTIYGDVTATGNGTTAENNPDTDGSGSITITASDVDVYGTLTSASNTQGTKVKIPGIEDSAVTWTPGDINNPYASMADIADRFAHTTDASAVDGNITITANGIADGSGNVNLYFGNKEEGFITTGGNLTVTGTGNVFVNSDLDIEGNMTLTSTGKDGEVLLTLTNIGKVQANRFTEVIEKAINGIEVIAANENKLINAINLAVGKEFPDLGFSDDPKKAEAIVRTLLSGNNKVEAIDTLNNDVAIEYMHDFMHSFERSNNQDTPGITLSSASGNSKLTVDMWEDNDNGTGQFNFEKYDSNSIYTSDEHTFLEELNNLNLTINNNSNIDAADVVYVEVRNGEQLKGIQDYVDSNVENASDALKFNYALMGDINASDVENYVAIGTGSEFTGTFDGRGNRIIGLDTTKSSTGNGNTLTNVGIFSTIGEGGTVKNVNIYSGNFEGTNTAGSVAGMNSGRIENVTGFGNTVTVTGASGNAGGIVGVNNGKSDFAASDSVASTLTGNGIYDVQNVGSVIAGGNKVVAGGLVGLNAGALGNSYSDSAVTVKPGVTLDKDTTALGGVVGVNTENGDVRYVDSLGITNGGTNSSNVGGIIGVNKGNMYSGYNESIVSGNDNVGGIIGTNSSEVENVVNATSVTGENKTVAQGDDGISEYVGGLVGSNSGSVTNGRNNGTITGTNYVGGMVGSNAQGATLTNLVNDSSAAIEGENYVGGIAGTNAGTITAQNQSNLINRGSITGQNYVGGVAGENIGTIEYVKNDVNLYVKDDTKTAQYFGGVAGINGRVDDETTTDVNEAVTGTITSATNEGDVVAENAQYVGGIVGWNTSQGKLVGMGNSNEGTVIGGSYVGGVIGKNDAAIGSKDSAQVGITNEGTVIATKGGAGGLIGENNAAITNTVMINRGEVHGNNTANDNSGTGGIIGVNMGDITYSSLINEVTGTVTGTNNVGGLIGVNKADITGGRYTVTGEDAGMYINKIYNNGVINVGTYGDTDNDGDYEFTAGTGSNIGGLIGDNKGSLTAGYNTGAINAADSENVGGIAGSNSGTIDQVFNTVMTPDNAVKPDGSKQEASITGGTNVGGLVGDNQANGEITNAYNTSNVVATNQYGIVGGLVGNNQENGEITNAYNTSNVVTTNQDGIVGNLVGTNSGTVQYVYGVADKLIGNGNAAEYGYVIDGSDTWLQEGTYEDFAFGANGWKIYDGSTLPMLSVFLTKVTVVDQHLVNQYFSAKHYGELHQITADDIKALIAIGAISAPDGFGAFNNNNGLIQGVADDAIANSGNWLYSQQILGSNINGLFNPNNLGYDISLVYSPFENEDWPHNRWNYLFNDAPFDRNKDFRERKAEVNFVDGGMEI